MKIVIFTPVNKRSAIGHAAVLMVRELTKRGHEITVVSSETPELLKNPTYDFGVPIICWDSTGTVEQLLSQADLPIYQIGDNYLFHQGCLHWMPRAPGIICLHDYFLGNLFQGWALENVQLRDIIVQEWYGTDALEAVKKSRGTKFIQDTYQLAPMTEWFCSFGLGIMTHSAWDIQRVLKSCAGPVVVAPLCYDSKVKVSQQDEMLSEGGQLVVATIGHINPNKRVLSVIRALSQSETLRRNVEYRLIGAITPEVEEQISELANKLQVNVVIEGELDDESFAEALEEVDVFCCLRWPSLEAGSASVIDTMLVAKPALVTNTGCYIDIPDECVVKVHPDRELEDIQSGLRLLYHNLALRAKIGNSAREFARQNHTPEVYIDAMLDLVDKVLAAFPRLVALRAITSIANSWGCPADLLSSPEVMEPLNILATKSEN